MGLLELQAVTVRYGGAVLALEDVSLEVGAGEAVALLGANGAGKTTLLRAIGGLLAYHGGAVVAGEIRFDGRSTARADAARLVAGGIAQTLEGRRVLADLTVEQNLRLGAFARRGDDRAAREQVLDLFPILRERAGQRAGLLSGGQQQMLALGRALMGRPRLLLLDEPSLGLAPKIFDTILDRVRAIHHAGASILIAEQNARKVLRLADHCYILENGAVAFDGPAADLARDARIERTYLGAGH